MAVYLDCNATTPVEPEVAEITTYYTQQEFGNAGSRTHEFGNAAKRIVQKSRDEMANLIDCRREEVIFTSGATEGNNIAILGLSEHGICEGKKHLITSAIEHKAVLEPFEELERRGFEVSYLEVDESGRVDPQALARELRDETLLVSLMQANNETGIRQPLGEFCEVLDGHSCYFHVDAAQGLGKDIEALHNRRIDLVSGSSHKIYGPKGVGVLVSRHRGFDNVPLAPLMFGGGQERGIRPGTLPVALIAGFGKALELARKTHAKRKERCLEIKGKAIGAFDAIDARYSGDQDWAMEHVINVSFNGVNSEAAIVLLKDLVAISNGSACTSSSYTPSHVLRAMGMTEDEANCCVRISWCHLTPEVDWHAVAERLKQLI